MLHRQFWDVQSTFSLFSVSFESYEDSRLLCFAVGLLFSQVHRNGRLLLSRSSGIHLGWTPVNAREENNK